MGFRDKVNFFLINFTASENSFCPLFTAFRPCRFAAGYGMRLAETTVFSLEKEFPVTQNITKKNKKYLILTHE